MAARYDNASPYGFIIMVVGDPSLVFTPTSVWNVAALILIEKCYHFGGWYDGC